MRLCLIILNKVEEDNSLLPVDKYQIWEICQLRKKYTQVCHNAQPMYRISQICCRKLQKIITV
jgi:hypothetical protein